MPVKSFVVIDGDLRLLIERGEKMYVASSLDIRGLNTQGKTIEEAIENAHDAAKNLSRFGRSHSIREIVVTRKSYRPVFSGSCQTRNPLLSRKGFLSMHSP